MLLAVSAVAGALGAVTSCVAAVLWLLSFMVVLPRFPDVGWDSSGEVFDPVQNALAKSARLNAWAAGAACVAAICAAVVFLCGLKA